jgi:hypothetical protein
MRSLRGVILSEASRCLIARSGVEGSAVRDNKPQIPFDFAQGRLFDSALARSAQDDTFGEALGNRLCNRLLRHGISLSPGLCLRLVN